MNLFIDIHNNCKPKICFYLTGDLVYAPGDIKWKAPGKNATNNDLLVFRMSGEAGSFIGHLLIKSRKSKGDQKTKDQLVSMHFKILFCVKRVFTQWEICFPETIVNKTNTSSKH